MVIKIIKRKEAPKEREVAPVVPPEPVAAKPVPFDERPVAQSLDELRANPTQFRAPAPRECKFCENLYAFPCDGASKTCMNAEWKRARLKS